MDSSNSWYDYLKEKTPFTQRPYLRSPTDPPAIRMAMARATSRAEKGQPVSDFASGNVGNLPVNFDFAKMDLKPGKDLPEGVALVSEAFMEGLNQAASKPRCLAYSMTGGTKEDKKLALEYFEEFHGVDHGDLGKVIATAGGQEAMAVALRSLRPGTNVYMSRWDYAPPISIIKDNNCEPVKLNVDEGLEPDIQELKEEVKDFSVFYISMPNNPSGFVSAEILEDIVKVMVASNGAVIWDAPYLFTLLELGKNGASFNENLLNETIDKFRVIGKKYSDHVCIASSISKTCLCAGLRYGFLTANRHWIESAKGIIGREDLSAPTLSFFLGREILKSFLKSPITYRWLDEKLANRLNSLFEEDLPLILPKNGKFGALYVLLRTGDLTGQEFSTKAFEDYGVVTVPAKSFYGESINAVRLSLVSTPWTEGDRWWLENVDVLSKAIEELT